MKLFYPLFIFFLFKIYKIMYQKKKIKIQSVHHIFYVIAVFIVIIILYYFINILIICPTKKLLLLKNSNDFLKFQRLISLANLMYSFYPIILNDNLCIN